MMDWTDRHCRNFHRLLSSRVRLYTEMITADAIIHGDRDRLLGFSDAEHPVAVQLGGSDPDKLAQAAQIAAGYGYDEINLNIGCPSDRVQAGTFGACLMRDPGTVGQLVAAMKNAVAIPVTVKCRLGVDDQDIEVALDALVDTVLDKGCDGIWVHARKAWLNGLSAKDNRNVPPLDYGRVERLKARLPDCFIGINGGIATVDEIRSRLAGTDGVMIGRIAYRRPEILLALDGLLAGNGNNSDSDPDNLSASADLENVVKSMADYADDHCRAGGHLSSVTRHMIGLFGGRPGARRWRQILTEQACRPGAGPDVIIRALAQVGPNRETPQGCRPEQGELAAPPALSDKTDSAQT